jgi:guanylate kinase
VLSAPSGAGKSSIVKRVMARVPDLVFSVSATTRTPRAGERDGVDYTFMDRARFEEAIRRGELLEHAEVHGNLYGTPGRAVDAALARGEDVLLDIDVQGAGQVRASRPDATLVFILPPSRAELERRLRGRGLDAEATIALRLRNATREVAEVGAFDHVIVNEDLDAAASELEAVVRALRTRRCCNGERVRHVASTFGVDLAPTGEAP